MATCKWCGRTFAGAAQTGLFGGDYPTCSESCRLELARSVAAGTTAAHQTPATSGLKLLLKVFLVLGIGSYISTRCGGESAVQPEATTTEEHRVAPAAEAPPQESPQPRQGFGAPGQFSEPPTAEPEPEEAEQEGEIRTMPAPEPAGVDPIAPDSNAAS